MSRSKGTHNSVDAKTSLSVTVHPFTTHSVVTVDVGAHDRAGWHRSRIAQWHVRLTRADLAGHRTDDVVLAILGMVVHRLESGRFDPADWHATRRPSTTAVGPGAPASGATGAVQDPLPGAAADSSAPGSVGGV